MRARGTTRGTQALSIVGRRLWGKARKMRPGITETLGSFQLVSFTHPLVFARASGVYLKELWCI